MLGPLRILDGEAEVTPTRRRERQLLCALALHAGRAVDATLLADAIWEGAPPPGERKAIQTHVFRVRRQLGDGVVVTERGGYTLGAEPARVDAVRFETGATHDPATNEGGAAEALLGLWRGRPYDELADWPPAVLARSRLDEAHATLAETVLQHDLTLGGRPIASLEGLVEQEPLRERRWMLLMLALYRSDRQADALRAYERARKVLATELGLSPGARLSRLERAILEHDPRLHSDDPDTWLSEGDEESRAGPVAVVEARVADARASATCGAHEAAMESYRAAIGAARDARLDVLVLIDLLVEAADVAEHAGEPRLVVSMGEEAAGLARARNDPLRFARAALATAGRGWASGMDPNSPVIDLLEEATERLSTAPTILRARLLARLAAAECHCRPIVDARRHSREALGIARLVEDPETTALALYARLVADTDPHHAADNAALAEQLLELGREHEQTRWQAWALSVLPRHHAVLGDIEAAERGFLDLAMLGERTGDPFAAHQATYGLSLRPTIEGDHDGAVAAAEQVRRAAERALVDPSGAAIGYHGTVGLLRVLRGDAYEVDRDTPVSWPQSTMQALGHAFTAVALVSGDDGDGARRVLEGIDPAALAKLPRDMYWSTMVALFAMACSAVHDEPRAEVLYELASPEPDQLVINPGGIFVGAVHHHLGVLAATTSRAGAEAHLDAAVEIHRRLGSRPWEQRTLRAREAMASAV